MIPIRIDSDEDCYCGRRDWRRGTGQAGRTVVWCDNCGYVVAVVEATTSNDGT